MTISKKLALAALTSTLLAAGIASAAEPMPATEAAPAATAPAEPVAAPKAKKVHAKKEIGRASRRERV